MQGGLPRCKPEMTALEHGCGKAGHYLLCLHMQITIKLVRAPAPYEPNAIGPNPGTQKCHRATGASGTRGDIARGDGGVGVDGEGRAHAPR